MRNHNSGIFERRLAAGGWAVVNRKAADDDRLSIDARGVLAWLLTRPDDHQVFVSYLQKRCGISQAKWQRIRRELERAWYLRVERLADFGKFEWRYYLTDTPEPD